MRAHRDRPQGRSSLVAEEVPALDDDRKWALAIAVEYALQEDATPHAGGVHEDAAWIVARVWLTGRVLVWRVRPAEGIASITVALAWWEFSDEEIEAVQAERRQGYVPLTVGMVLSGRGVERHPVD